MGIAKANCPECQSQINVDPLHKAEICPYCQKPFVVSDAIRLSQSKPAGRTKIIRFGQFDWRILYSWNGKRALLIAEQAVCKRAFHDEFKEVTWENCSLREWLNTEFLNECFTRKDREAIVRISGIPADENPTYQYLRYKQSADSVFLLSIQEAKKLFKSKEGRMCSCHDEPCFWWLRTPIKHSDFAAVVDYDGTINNEEGFIVHGTSGGVRPAMIIKTTN